MVQDQALPEQLPQQLPQVPQQPVQILQQSLQGPQYIMQTRRTHKDEITLALLSKLLLHEKLARNKDIEEKKF